MLVDKRRKDRRSLSICHSGEGDLTLKFTRKHHIEQRSDWPLASFSETAAAFQNFRRTSTPFVSGTMPFHYLRHSITSLTESCCFTMQNTRLRPAGYLFSSRGNISKNDKTSRSIRVREYKFATLRSVIENRCEHLSDWKCISTCNNIRTYLQ